MTNDPNYVKRTAVVALALLVAVVTLLIFVGRSGHDDALTERKRLDICRTITDEQLRRDCVTGPQLQSEYPR